MNLYQVTLELTVEAYSETEAKNITMAIMRCIQDIEFEERLEGWNVDSVVETKTDIFNEED